MPQPLGATMQRGFFRLWVLSVVLWGAFILTVFFERITSPRAPDIAGYVTLTPAGCHAVIDLANSDPARQWEKINRQSGLVSFDINGLPQFVVYAPYKELLEDAPNIPPLSWNNETPNRHPTVSEFQPCLAIAVKQAKDDLENRTSKERWAAVKEFSAALVVPSLALFLLGCGVAWVVRGFREEKN